MDDLNIPEGYKSVRLAHGTLLHYPPTMPPRHRVPAPVSDAFILRWWMAVWVIFVASCFGFAIGIGWL